MSDLPFSYHRKYLRIDLTSRQISECDIPAHILRNWMGGTGLGTWILLRETNETPDALSPEAPLVITFSPLIGTPFTTSAKFAMVAKSPLTHRMNDALLSSRFAIAGKKTGYDAIVVVGKSEQLTLLIIDSEKVRFHSAEEYRGLSSSKTEARIAQDFSSHLETLSIGLAGENLVSYATVSHSGRHAGRGGMGAVMGAKLLKAIAVRGETTLDVAFPHEVVQYSKRLSQLSLGSGTEKYRKLGTVNNLPLFHRLGILPTRNFQQTSFDASQFEFLSKPEPIMEGESGSENDSIPRMRTSCASCNIGCEHQFLRPVSRTVSSKNQEREAFHVRMEYENMFALGPLCGIEDPAAIIEASALCDELGLDTISAGGTIAFAMECVEHQLISEPGMRFGRKEGLLQTLKQIAHREGIGEVLARGTREASRILGEETRKFASHVKGLEIPGYDPRTMQAMALGFAVGTRGADHNRSGAYQHDFSASGHRLQLNRSDVPFVIAIENEAVLMDSLILCKFLRGVFEDKFQAMGKMLRLSTGWEISREELITTANRIVTAKKWYNILQGWQPAEDSLPDRFFHEPVSEGLSSGAILSRESLQTAIEEYNLQRGWSVEGWISNEQLKELEIVE